MALPTCLEENKRSFKFGSQSVTLAHRLLVVRRERLNIDCSSQSEPKMFFSLYLNAA